MAEKVSFLKKLQKWIKGIVLLFFGSSIFFVFLYKYCAVPVTPLMLIRCTQQAWHGENIRLKHHWVPLDSISPYLPEAVMCSEDSKFLQHSGFDFKQISIALDEREQGKRNRGASTISQQTAKNVFLWNGGGFFRKGLEAYFTLLIEIIWGKRRIMEVYLNSIEMGDGIYGAEACAQQHFGCAAIDLSRRHCALIATSLPNPRKRDSSAPSSYMLRQQTKIMRDMRWIERTQAAGDLSIFKPQEKE